MERALVDTARIVVAERWSILRRGMVAVLATTHTVVDDFEDVTDMVPVLGGRKVDVAIVGIRAGQRVDAVVTRLREAQEDLHVVVLCDRIGPEPLRVALQAGASAVLSKKLDDDALRDSIARVLGGERVVDQSFLPLLFDGEDPTVPANAPSLLTVREQDVLAELARGASNREIADALLMSESTVKSHLSHIYAKLDVNNRHGAVSRALEMELLA